MAARSHYEYQLNEVQRALLQLHSSVERAIKEALRALERHDVNAARRIVRADDDIDERRANVEERVLRLIAAQQPLATDLRFLLGVLRIADELERIGDYAEGIAALVIRDVDQETISEPLELTLLAEQVQTMLQLSVTAFIERDASKAAQLEQADDRADELSAAVQAAMLRRLQAEPRQASSALHMLFVAHNLERIADRAVNIGERTSFIVTGTLTHRHS